MKHEIIIVGGGVSGTALLYTLTKYSNIKNIGLIEKYRSFGLVNSASTMNSQTLHFGDIETNYSLEKAKKVKQSADMVKHYLEDEKERPKGKDLYPGSEDGACNRQRSGSNFTRTL
jgi:malate dehydrogenase (quinone)